MASDNYWEMNTVLRPPLKLLRVYSETDVYNLYRMRNGVGRCEQSSQVEITPVELMIR